METNSSYQRGKTKLNGDSLSCNEYGDMYDGYDHISPISEAEPADHGVIDSTYLAVLSTPDAEYVV